MPRIELIEAVPPDYGLPDAQPQIGRGIYENRLGRLVDAAQRGGLDAVAVYADREHFANLAYLTGFEPRFEEALLVVLSGSTPVLVTGPENQGYSEISPIELIRELYPPFGLLGQDRSKTRPLGELLHAAGLRDGFSVGLAGWKYFSPEEMAEPERCLEAPAYIVDALRSVVGNRNVVNAASLLMHPSSGLRAVNEIDQLAQFEHAACHASEAVKRVIAGIRPGMSEVQAASGVHPLALPFSCHPIFASGPRIRLGLCSPTDRKIAVGEPAQVAVGVWGALTCRAGWLVAEEDELPPSVRDYVDRLAAPYFDCVAEWYETVGIGVAGGTLNSLVADRLGDPFFGVSLNPGHLIHFDEWMNTPIYDGSTEALQSGQAIQADIIPATGTEYGTANLEDGIALLDARGRSEFCARHPDAWARIEARRAFMHETLGIRLRPEVLPLSNLAGCLSPYLLSPGRILARR